MKRHCAVETTRGMLGVLAGLISSCRHLAHFAIDLHNEVSSRNNEAIPEVFNKMMTRRTGWTAMICIAGLAAAAWGVGAQADMIYVDVDATTGANTGASWTDAYVSLESALAAATSEDEIWVAEGAYKPSLPADRDATFQLRNGVALYGGFSGTETLRSQRNWTSHETILSGDIGAPSDSSDNVYHVVTSISNDATAILDGFTITAGNANGYPDVGGGMVVSGSSPTLANCIFENNRAGSGGGMFNEDASSPTLTNCVFYDNTADSGGGMFNEEASTPTLTNCTFIDNYAYGDGGGIYSEEESSPILINCTFTENYAQRGGGMFNDDSSPILTNCTFSDNQAYNDGGGMFNNYYASSPTLTNCTFADNAATNGGGLYNDDDSSPTLGATIVANNTASAGPDIHGSVASAGYNLISDSTACTGLGLTDLTGIDPLLGPLADNGGSTLTHALLVSSPAISAVPSTEFPSVTTDQREVPRPQGSACDIGAYEVPEPEMTVSGLGVEIPDENVTPSLANNTDFGVITATGGSKTNTFTITNSGGAELSLPDTPRVTIAGTHAGDFTLSTDAASSVAGGSTTTFTVAFDPSAVGIRTATISIANDDLDKNPYNFAIQGHGTDRGDIDGNGVTDVLDARLCLQIALGSIEGTTEQRVRADVDSDGDVDMNDAIVLAEYIIDMRNGLP